MSKYHRRPSNTRRNDKHNCGGTLMFLQLIVCVVLLGGLMIFRITSPDNAANVREFVAEQVSGGINVSEAVQSVFGRQSGSDEDDTYGDDDDIYDVYNPDTSDDAEDELGDENEGMTLSHPPTADALWAINDDRDAEDDTAPVPFGFSVPDNVSFTAYPINFPHQNPLAVMALTSRFGYRVHPIYRDVRFHFGIDLGSAPIGTNIYAFADGTVSRVGYNSINGHFFRIEHADGFETVYLHCHRIFVEEGDTVTKGQRVASVGNTGSSTGPHLHFEIRRHGVRLNPLHYVTVRNPV